MSERRTAPGQRWLAGLAAGLLVATATVSITAPASAWSAEARPLADDPALEARMMALAAELRCVVCQNQTLADSHADLAVDLRQQMREQLAAGKSPEQVRTWLTDRYGDFVLYRPPLKPLTWLLWFGPGVLLLGGAALGLRHLQRRAALPASAFEPEAGLTAMDGAAPDADNADAFDPLALPPR